MPLASLDRISIAFGHLPLLDDVSLQIDPRERVSIIGRNGTGKSTLLGLISGETAPDAGTVWRQPALRVARLEQDVPLSAHRSVFDVVAEGHTHHLEEDDEWLREHHVDLVLSRPVTYVTWETQATVGVSSEAVKEAFVVAVEAALELGDTDKAAELIASVDALPPGRSPQFLQAQMTLGNHLANDGVEVGFFRNSSFLIHIGEW